MKIKISVLIVSIFLSFSNKVFAQGEANIWYFGNYAGIDFNLGSPVALTNGTLTTSEGCAAISTSAGSLRFYTDGMTIWNNTHLPMSNGTGLLGNSSTTQSGMIVPKPGSPNIYYVFTLDCQGQQNGLNYSEVDMTLAGGLGDVTATKNIHLADSLTEKLTAVKKANNVDYWVIARDYAGDAFFVYSVTSSGVNATPIISHAGTVDGTWGGGYLKASADGSKLVQAITGKNKVDVFNFDNVTGLITTDFSFTSPYAYGVELSLDRKRLYVTSVLSFNIFQYDLTLGSASAIIASATLVATANAHFYGLAAIQMGPDGKIYVAKPKETTLGCITNPNALGVSCSYVDMGVDLLGMKSTMGLPNFMPTYSTTSEPCVGITADFSMSTPDMVKPNTDISFTNLSTSGTNLSWNFGDPASGTANVSSLLSPMHTYTTEGVYCITLIATNTVNCSDIINKCITVVNEIEIPNTFTPNGDGKNDVFAIKHLQLGVAPIKIYDRWGTIVYQSSGYNNDWTGKNVSNGVYYYILDYPIDKKTYTGFVHVF